MEEMTAGWFVETQPGLTRWQGSARDAPQQQQQHSRHWKQQEQQLSDPHQGQPQTELLWAQILSTSYRQES
jgi:hypothetical protein